MSSPAIDFEASTLTIRTRAKGMLARLAHDLEIAASRFEGDVELEEEAWNARLSFAVAELRVAGALKGGRVDPQAISNSDKQEIERRMQSDVLPIDKVHVTMVGRTRTRAEVTVVVARGQQQLSVPMRVEQRDGGALVIFGDLKLSLKRLGIQEIKAPLGAFRVADSIEVAFWIQLVQA